MNITRQHQTALPTSFKLKPLLIAIPLSVLAACANNQAAVSPEEQDQIALSTSNIETHEKNELKTETNDITTEANNIPIETTNVMTDVSTDTGPDLTHHTRSKEQPLNSSPAIGTSDTAESPVSNNPAAEHTTEGSAPMTVLVIENPEILSKLGNANITQVKPSPPKSYKESLHRPGKRVFHFGFNQSSLSEEDIDLIEQHAEYLKANPELQVTVHGHTDAQGNADYNLKLSQQRAAMMVSELIKQGISKDRIKTIGWGGGYPLVSTLNFAENRRIEIEYSAVHYAANQ